jgi:amino-acid N-acetyltransferase
MNIQLRPGRAGDGQAIHAMIAANMTAGHLLPRSLDDIEEHIERFVVAVDEATVVGCAELAPLSDTVAEVRSLVVDESHRGQGIGGTLVTAVADGARTHGFLTLCAFTHQPSHFMRVGFSIVPHVWVPEKIAHDCAACSQFRRCGQYAVSLALRAVATPRPAERSGPSRVVAPRRASVERLRLITVVDEPEAVPA